MDELKKVYSLQFDHFDQLFESQRRLREQMRALAAPYLRFREGMERWIMPYRRLQEEVQKWAEPHRQMQDQIRKWVEPQQKLQEQMQRLVEPYRQLQEQMQKWVEPYQQLQKQMEKWLVPSTALKDYVWEASRLRYGLPEIYVGINKLLDTVDQETFRVNEADIITVGNQTVSSEEFTDMYTVFVESLGKLPSPAEAIAFVWEYVNKLAQPLATLLLFVVLPYLINISSNLTTPYFEELIGQMSNKPKREQMKAIKSEAAMQFDGSVLREYRFVSADVLQVRGGASIRSTILADIRFGQVVKVIRKGRKWSYVECVDEDTDLTVRGWVFNRYLSRFK